VRAWRATDSGQSRPFCVGGSCAETRRRPVLPSRAQAGHDGFLKERGVQRERRTRSSRPALEGVGLLRHRSLGGGRERKPAADSWSGVSARGNGVSLSAALPARRDSERSTA
jgi:hypothetical protein